MLGLAIALAISALLNLALLISQRTRETILSAGRCLIRRVQAVRADPNTGSTFPGPPRDEEAQASSQPPPPPQPPQQPAIVWPTVRPSAPPPPPRVLSYGAKGIFETGNPNYNKRVFLLHQLLRNSAIIVIDSLGLCVNQSLTQSCV